MPNYHYRALTSVGKVVSGTIDAPAATEARRRIEYLGLVPIEGISEQTGESRRRRERGSLLSRVSPEEVTEFTGDLALLLRTGARINQALELLLEDREIGRIKPTIVDLAASVQQGKSFAESLLRHPTLFPPLYVAMIRVAEASGALTQILETLCRERRQSEALRRRLWDALRYPAFLLLAAGGVLFFFLLFVLPQFAQIFHDFNAQLDPVLAGVLAISTFLRANTDALLGGSFAVVTVGWLALRRGSVRQFILAATLKLPLVRRTAALMQTELFCRNLGLLLESDVTLPVSLRILADLMDGYGAGSLWIDVSDSVRRGGKLSEALQKTKAIPPTAVRTLRLGEETGELASSAARIADFYKAKLLRRLDRLTAAVGPVAIVAISGIVGGLIVLVMTALLSVNQIVG